MSDKMEIDPIASACQQILNALARHMAGLITYESKPEVPAEELEDRKKDTKPVKAKITQLSKLFYDWQGLNDEQREALIKTVGKALEDIGKEVTGVVGEVMEE
ncbi:hypothetical protein BU25DRAFT_447475 [Macroventuria anomochaeta]|uniref:Uncharacterized protein n=1 Tax=Macroventuria anomochaeta TaxID=301207 RepID=A0ACB6S3X3_9PLEO|nr:uncharacterized protein BU25DRAFT_447475 [Macroventuria anomochaeta]KAF2628955.1 hypothetical protein BU25DRAFT_447475 [Macroventuria anomochaeta]